MPIYEYECRACHQTFEVMQKVSERGKAICPFCESQNVQRCLSAPMVQFKGSGWYESDYKKKKPGQKNGEKADKKEACATCTNNSEATKEK